MITLEPHQKTWKTNFIQDKEKLSAILSDIVISIEHIGSTAIPGIKAKPVIDIMIGVKDIQHKFGLCL
jgi:GrpB-like predicted nucleotidyltransferase (UPF0157 family)